MWKTIIIVWALSAVAFLARGQDKSVIAGIVFDELNKPLPGCHVHWNENCTLTDTYGNFRFEFFKQDDIHLKFSFVGYKPYDTVITHAYEDQLKIYLKPEIHAINEISVEVDKINLEKSRKNEFISADFITRNLQGTFVKSIESIAGVNSIDVGANASKPVIRGMSFNRVVVSENGIKQEGQQWGADHGLEIDPFAIESVEIVKGASAIEFGSDAIGGYINVMNDKVLTKQSFSGAVSLLGKSVNNTFGGSLNLEGRSEKWYFKVRGSIQNFGDYHIPTDTIVYLTRSIPIYNEKLKNTAGDEHDFSGQIGYINSNIKSSISISSVFQKSGFFPGSHGVPDINRVKDDENNRNVEFPYQNASHDKVINNSMLFIKFGKIVLDLAYQKNHRQEWSSFHTHFPNQPEPIHNKDLELDFQLVTYSGNLKMEIETVLNHDLSFGVQNSYKDNQIDGYSFLLPEYQSISNGVFVKDIFTINSKTSLTAGLRYDYNKINTSHYFDTVLFNYFSDKPEISDQADFYAQRSVSLNRSFGDVSWLAGLIYKPNALIISRFNIGRAFRNPTAIELASNGIHHGSFTHEIGDSSLNSEKGYYLDVSLEINTIDFNVNFSPYLYFFDNYIYLNPSTDWSKLPHAGQIYKYSQSKALISGIELSFKKIFFDNLTTQINLEYIYNKKLTDDKTRRFPLPFTPPVNGFIELNYKLSQDIKFVSEAGFFINSKLALAQQNQGQNEEETDGYIVFGVGFSSKINFGNQQIDLIFQATNLFDTKYFNHINYYRKLEIPELGRNIQLTVKVPFEIK